MTFDAQIRTFRMQVDYCYKHLIGIFHLETIFEPNDLVEDDLDKNKMFETLTVLKLRMEYIF